MAKAVTEDTLFSILREKEERIQQLERSIYDAQFIPQVRVYNSSSISIPTSTATTLTFDSERWDSGTDNEQHSVSTNTERLTCMVTGLYEIQGQVVWDANATGHRTLSIRLNGSTTIAADQMPAVTTAASGTIQSVQTQYRLGVGDYVELRGTQTSGGNLLALALSAYTPEFMWHWVGP